MLSNGRKNRKLAVWQFLVLLHLSLCTLIAFAANSHSEQAHMLTDFSTNSPDMGWYIQNDSVMGGRSEGRFKQSADTLVFTGTTNTDGGGFSSIRTHALKLDLSSQKGMRLQVMGDGRRYSWQLQTNALWQGRRISYWAYFETTEGEWQQVDIPFAQFSPRFRGRQLDGPALDATQITSMGLYIYDKKDGAFVLHLSSVGTY